MRCSSSRSCSEAECRHACSPRFARNAGSRTTSTLPTAAYTDTGSFYSGAGVDVDRVDEAITTILGELRKVAAEPVPLDELEKARGYAKGRFVLRLESPQGTIQYGLRREVLEGEIEEPDDLLARLDEVTVEDVQRVARDLFEDKRLYLALVGPFDDPARFEKLVAA